MTCKDAYRCQLGPDRRILRRRSFRKSIDNGSILLKALESRKAELRMTVCRDCVALSFNRTWYDATSSATRCGPE